MNAVLLACLLLTLPVQSSDSPPLPGQPSVSFTRDVYPILSRNCLQCHGPVSYTHLTLPTNREV